jgi:serine protease Do
VALRVDDEEVTVRFPEEVPLLMKSLADLPVGTRVELTYDRQGSVSTATIVTEKLQKDRGDEAAFRAWGVVAQEITEKMRRDQRLDSAAGVLVSSVRSGGPAQLSEPPLAAGDVIRAVNGQSVDKLASFVEAYEALMAGQPLPEQVLVEFDRRGKNYLTLLRPRPEEQRDSPRELPKAWIGLATQPVVRRLAEELGLEAAQGYRITRVYPDTTAAGTDLQVGDVIVALNGEPLIPRGMQDAGLLARQVRRLTIGDSATLTVARGDKTSQVEVELERTRITPEEARRDENRDFELAVREVTFFDRDENRWTSEIQGVLVDQVEAAGWAGLAGVRPGDLIQRIQEHEIRDVKSYRRVMGEVAAAQPERVVMIVLRGVRTNFLYLEPDWAPVSGSMKPREE